MVETNYSFFWNFGTILGGFVAAEDGFFYYHWTGWNFVIIMAWMSTILLMIIRYSVIRCIRLMLIPLGILVFVLGFADFVLSA